MHQQITGETFEAILESLPLEVTFIDENDIVRYYSKGQKAHYLKAIGKNVRDCHPQKSLDKVNEVINVLKSGERDVAEFWINSKGHKVYISYFPVRDKAGKYLGIIEVVQDITEFNQAAKSK